VFLGAVSAAMLTVWLTQGLRTAGGLTEDAGAGVVFTTLFAIGVVLVGLAPPGTHLDAACVLHGELAFLPFDTISIAGQPVPRAFVAGATVLAGLVAAAVATWKLQVFTAFDPAGARAAGLPVVGVTTGLLAATVDAFVAAADRLTGDASLAAQLRANSLQHARRTYAQDVVIARMLAHYDAIGAQS
jgi:ABC-type Mn2+/Zn2+ transport system permease subunit